MVVAAWPLWGSDLSLKGRSRAARREFLRGPCLVGSGTFGASMVSWWLGDGVSGNESRKLLSVQSAGFVVVVIIVLLLLLFFKRPHYALRDHGLTQYCGSRTHGFRKDAGFLVAHWTVPVGTRDPG